MCASAALRRPHAFEGALRCLRGGVNLPGAVLPSWACCLHALAVLGQFHRDSGLWAPEDCAEAILSSLWRG